MLNNKGPKFDPCGTPTNSGYDVIVSTKTIPFLYRVFIS